MLKDSASWPGLWCIDLRALRLMQWDYYKTPKETFSSILVFEHACFWIYTVALKYYFSFTTDMSFICFSTDFRTQRLDIPDTAVYWQQGGTNTNRGRVAVLWCDRGSEWMAEPQRCKHIPPITVARSSFSILHYYINLSSWLLLLHRQKQWIQDQSALPMLHVRTIK